MFVSISAAVETDADATGAAEFCDVADWSVEAAVAGEACDGAAVAPAALLATVEDVIRLFVGGTDPLTLTPEGATEVLLALVEDEEDVVVEDDDSGGEDTDDGDSNDGPTTLLLLAKLTLLLLMVLLLLLL